MTLKIRWARTQRYCDIHTIEEHLFDAIKKNVQSQCSHLVLKMNLSLLIQFYLIHIFESQSISFFIVLSTSQLCLSKLYKPPDAPSKQWINSSRTINGSKQPYSTYHTISDDCRTTYFVCECFIDKIRTQSQHHPKYSHSQICQIKLRAHAKHLFYSVQ